MRAAQKLQQKCISKACDQSIRPQQVGRSRDVHTHGSNVWSGHNRWDASEGAKDSKCILFPGCCSDPSSAEECSSGFLSLLTGPNGDGSCMIKDWQSAGQQGEWDLVEAFVAGVGIEWIWKKGSGTPAPKAPSMPMPKSPPPEAPKSPPPEAPKGAPPQAPKGPPPQAPKPGEFNKFLSYDAVPFRDPDTLFRIDLDMFLVISISRLLEICRYRSRNEGSRNG